MLNSNKSRILLLFILYGTMVFFGVVENIKGVSFPLIKNEFGVSYEAQGLMISLISISYTLFVIISGFMLGRFGLKKIYILSFIFIFLGVSSIYLMFSFWAVAVSLVFLFAGFGVLEIAINSVATKIFLTKTALMMNLLHFMYGVGAIIGPKITGILANPAGAGLLWRQIYILTIPLIMIVFIPTIFTKFPVLENTGALKKTHSYINALKTPSVWAFGIVLGIMVSMELAPSNWGGLYFQDLYGMDPTTRGANFVSTFYLMFTLSRLISGFIIEKVGYMRSLFGAILISLVIYIIGFSLGPAGIYILPFLGLFLGIFWPTIIAVCVRYFGNEAPLKTSAVISIGGLVYSGIQLVMGYMNLWIGAGWGFRSCFFFALMVIWLLFGLNRLVKKNTTEHYQNSVNSSKIS